MGWLWNSSSKDQQPNPSQESHNAPAPPTQPNTPRTMTREEQADEEFKQLWASLESDVKSSQTSSTPFSSTTTQTSQEIAPTSSIAPESLYPETMSCRSAFDYAFFCQSFGGQFVNVYRYGELRSCSEHWDNFWLCMKTRQYSDPERKKAIRDHYRKKAIKYKTGPSSEDVWEVRTEPVRNAFSGDFGALEREMKLEEERMQPQLGVD